MSGYITAERISDVWIETLESVTSAQGGTATHLMVVVESPEEGVDDRAFSFVI
jgi:hypothetical protein